MKTLPKDGVFVRCANLPQNSTAEYVSEFLNEIGFSTTPDRIVIGRDQRSCLIALSKEDIVALIVGAVGTSTMGERTPYFTLPAPGNTIRK